MQEPLRESVQPAHAPLTDRGARVLGGLMLLAGLAAVVFPFAGGVAASVYLGALIVVASVLRLARRGPSRSRRERVLDGLGAGLGVLAGVLLLVFPWPGLMTLTLLVAAHFAAQGVVKLIAAFQAEGRGRGWLGFGGALDLGLAVLVFVQWPIAAGWFLGLLLGVHLVMSGVTLLVEGSAATTGGPAPARARGARDDGTSHAMPSHG